MYDNTNVENRCRALWAEVLCALESRVTCINQYVPEGPGQIHCQMLDSCAVNIEHASAQRKIIASLDLKEHAILLDEFQGKDARNERNLSLTMLGDGNVYVTYQSALMGDAAAVAKFLTAALLASPSNTSLETMFN